VKNYGEVHQKMTNYLEKLWIGSSENDKMFTKTIEKFVREKLWRSSSENDKLFRETMEKFVREKLWIVSSENDKLF
jgi:hypothetical protein